MILCRFVPWPPTEYFILVLLQLPLSLYCSHLNNTSLLSVSTHDLMLVSGKFTINFTYSYAHTQVNDLLQCLVIYTKKSNAVGQLNMDEFIRKKCDGTCTLVHVLLAQNMNTHLVNLF